MDTIPYSNCNKCGVLFDLYNSDNGICRACVEDDPIWAVIQERDRYKVALTEIIKKRISKCPECHLRCTGFMEVCIAMKYKDLIDTTALNEIKEG